MRDKKNGFTQQEKKAMRKVMQPRKQKMGGIHPANPKIPKILIQTINKKFDKKYNLRYN